MNKFLLLIFVLNSTHLLAEEVDCNIVAFSPATDLLRVQIPNCLSDEMIFEEKENGAICNRCRNDFNVRVSVLPQDRVSIKKEAYIDSMLNQYKKAMSVLMSEIISARKLHSTDSRFNESQDKCSANYFKQKISSCSVFAKDRLGEVDQMMANELASLLTNKSFRPALHKRTQENQCSITDQDISMFQARLVERLITTTPGLIGQIAGIQANDQTQLTIQLNNISATQSSTVDTLIKQHPILASLMKEPSKFLSFFKQISRLPSENLHAGIQNLLYTKENGDLLDKSLAKRCKEAVEKISDGICSNKFNQGDINLGPMSGFERFNNEYLPTETVVTNETLLSKNIALLEFCSEASPDGISLNNDTNNLAPWLSDSEKNETYNSFASNHHQAFFSTPRNNLCKTINDVKNDSQFCEKNKNTPNCLMYQAYLDSQDPGNSLHQLAGTPDKDINNILRNMIGTPGQISPEATRVLVAEGILPQSNGQYVERPEIPERKPDYLANVANGRVTPSTGGAPTTPANLAARNVSSTNTRSNDQQTIFQPQESSFTASTANTAQDDVDELAVYRSLNERLSRLAAGPTTVGAAPRVAQAARPRVSGPKSASREENSSAPVFNPSTEASSNFGELASDQFNAPETRQAALAPASSASAEQRRSDAQRNAALSQFESARNNPFATGDSQGRNPASESDENSEKSISLTVSGDITTGLEQILSNSSTTGQDLRSLINSRESFQLELNGSIYGVNFKDNAYEVSLVNGNRNATRSILASLERVLNTSLSSSSGSRLQDLKNSIQ